MESPGVTTPSWVQQKREMATKKKRKEKTINLYLLNKGIMVWCADVWIGAVCIDVVVSVMCMLKVANTEAKETQSKAWCW